ncbi:MAG: 2-dehydro-3-deoxygalactonokinase [Aestuariivirga sp.]
MSSGFIALDWGTSSFRAYRLNSAGALQDTMSAPDGILAVKDADFDAALESHIGAWDRNVPIVASGMITSRQGWVELPYIACPASLKSIAAAIHTHISKQGRKLFFVPGISTRGPDGAPDVIRGEETQVLGASVGGNEHFVTPGTHSKWITVVNSEITEFSSYMTGEVFALLKTHSILGKLMTGETGIPAAFERGIRASLQDPAGFLHNIFSTRTLPLFSEMPTDHLSSYLSGLVIGAEIAHAIAKNSPTAQYGILATPALGEHYMTAMKIAGLQVSYGEPDIVIKGLRRIAMAAGILS